MARDAVGLDQFEKLQALRCNALGTWKLRRHIRRWRNHARWMRRNSSTNPTACGMRPVLAQ